MLALSWFLMASSALSSPITNDYCKGHDAPLLINDRRHQGLILASSIEELGQPFEEWEREMTEVAWKVAFFDDGFLDEGQMFQFVTTFPSRVSEKYLPVQNVEMEGHMDKRQAWLDLLRDSKVLVISQVGGNELYIRDAYCAGVAVIHLSDTETKVISTDSSSPQVPFRIAERAEDLQNMIIKVPRGDQMALVNAIDRVAMSPTTWLE